MGRAKGHRDDDPDTISRLQAMPSHKMLNTVAVAVGAAVFVLDIMLPLGVAGGVPYVALVLIGWWYGNHKTAYLFAAISSVLTVAGYFLSPDGGIPWVVFTNRAYALFVIWMTAVILATAMRDRGTLLRNEVKLKLAQRQAEAATLAKSRFLSSMSHELRTPMNAVIGYAQLMQHNPKEPLSEAQTTYTDNIINAGEMLLGLINGVLDMAKIEAGEMHVAIEDVSVRHVLDNSLKFAQPIADKAGIRLIDQTADIEGVAVRADALRLSQILLNFLSNAVKYNKPDGKVMVSCRETDQGYVRFSVADTGIGIPSHLHKELFKPFSRLGLEANKTIEGTGIGLTVTKQLVEQMGGRIGFDSEEGVGSTFWVEIPSAPNQADMYWTEKLSTGIADVDGDHRMLIDLMNALTNRSLECAEVDKVIVKLIEYTLFHFKREEAVMEACAYPGIESHRKVHQRFAEQVNTQFEEWQRCRGEEVVQALSDLLRGWLVDHILRMDTQIEPYTVGKEGEIAEALAHLTWPEETSPSQNSQTR